MDVQFSRSEQEREQYYGERYETVLEEIKLVRSDYTTIINKLENHDKRFNEMGTRIDAVKAASETAHNEIISRLERIESRLK